MNVALTNVCNLNCPYCFAGNIRKEQAVWISEEEFNTILNFHKASNEHSVRFIGGEPTLHPQFGRLVNRIIDDDWFHELLVFTNGTFSDEVLAVLTLASNIKQVRLLINLNEPSVVGEEAVKRIAKNLSRLGKTPITVTIGVNIYKPDMDVQYVFDTINSFRVARELRLSVVAPTSEEQRSQEPADYYRQFIPIVNAVVDQAIKYNIEIAPDCSFIPLCLFSKEEFLRFAVNSRDIFKRAVCNPVMDIMPDFTVIRCFGVDDERVDMRNFSSEEELYKYFMQRQELMNPYTVDECSVCPIFQKHNFGCGCKAFRRHRNGC